MLSELIKNLISFSLNIVKSELYDFKCLGEAFKRNACQSNNPQNYSLERSDSWSGSNLCLWRGSTYCEWKFLRSISRECMKDKCDMFQK